MSALAAMAEIGKGLVFAPSDDQLTDGYLRSYLARTSLDDLPSAASSYFHVADVYSASPEQLVAGLAPAPGTGDGDARVWYVFTPVRVLGSRGARKARTVGSGGSECWHAEGGPKDVKCSAAGGKLQKFSYKIKTASGVMKPGWLMVEYSFPGTDHLALCKVYRSPRTSRYNTPSPPSSAASSPSRAAPPVSSGRKRKAAEEVDHPERKAPASSAPRRTLPEDVAPPAPEQHQDVVVDAAAAAEPDQGGYLTDEQLDSIAAFVQEHEGDEEFYKSLGFDERADPQCWNNFFLSALEEFGPPETDADAAAEPGPWPEHEEHDELVVSSLPCTATASNHAYDSATAELVNLSDKEFYDILFSGDEEDGAAVAG